MKKILFIVILALAFGAVSNWGSVFAAEEGIGHYVPGAFADFMDIGPGPGLVLFDWYIHYHGSAGGGRQLPFGGVVAADISATSNTEIFGALYTIPCGFLGGKFSAGVAIPYIWLEVTGSITGPIKTRTRTDTVSGIGDIVLIPFWLGWSSGDFKWDVLLDVYAPTGEFHAGQLANPGLNYWTFEPMVMFSYMSKKIGLEISATAGVDFNTNNSATDYQSGDVFHVDATIAEHLPLFGGLIGVGANAFYWKQFTGDSGSGALLGSFETRMSGVGPVLSYVSPKFCGGHTIITEVKWLPQMDTSKTLKGDYIWFKAALAF
jgi:hypothetical protein